MSHLHAAPVFAAVPGSTHGYDVTNHGTLEPSLGGREGFGRMAMALKAEGLGLILDIVPNHMAAHPANPWWASVLRWGAQSPFAHHFDIDWSADRLLLPVLGTSYMEALEAGTFGVVREGGGFAMAVGEARLPLTPPSLALVLDRAGPGLAELALGLASAKQGSEGPLLEALATQEPAVLEAAAAAMNAERETLHTLHEAQVWRLAHWRLAREAITYRRFFEVTDLVGVRIERPEVFEDVHRLLFELVDAGLVDGVRVDHIDGLMDPAAYLARLRERLGQEAPIWVEKILHHDETLPEDWPVDGTTGYEFIADMADLFTDPAGEAAVTAAWCAANGTSPDPAPVVAEAKHHILTHNLAAELEALTDCALSIASRQLTTRDLGRDTLRRAIIAMAQACPVYRSYVSATGPRDTTLIDEMAEAARASREIENPLAVDFVAALLKLDVEEMADRVEALRFTQRFQQTTGPIAAKAIEDTVFYRYNRLIGLNEVGGSLDRFGADLSAVHGALCKRGNAFPGSINAGSTHDTKRGEDARARLYALSLAPDLWAAGATRWRGELAGAWGEEAERPEVAWLFFQALLGVWPFDLSSTDRAGLTRLRDRMAGFLTKALREAKADTNWTQVDPDFEAAALNFAGFALDPKRGAAFLDDFTATIPAFLAAGEIIGMGQALLRLTAPGVPEIYQGSEGEDLSLVDPDNRRPPDFATLEATLDTGAMPKQAMIARLLTLRAEAPTVFAQGSYEPLDAGPDVFAFARRAGALRLVVVVPIRRAVAALAGLPGAGAPQDVVLYVGLDVGLGDGMLRDVLTGEAVPVRQGRVSLPPGGAPWVLLHNGGDAPAE